MPISLSEVGATLAPIVKALGGELYDGGRRAVVPGPGHSRADRSVSLLLSQGRLVVHSFGRSTWAEVRADLRARGLLDDRDQPAEPFPIARSSPSQRPDERVRCAERIWSEGRSLGRTLGWIHVRRRGVTRATPISASLRYHAELPSAVYVGAGLRRPALLAAIHGADGSLCAVEVTYLNAAGGRAHDVRTPRKVIGAVPPSSAVRLDAPGSALLVGEGVFTTLSAAAHFRLPGWALLSTRNLRTWNAPQNVARVLIAADNGQDGQASARLLGRRLHTSGLQVTIKSPPERFSDWNEALSADWERPPPRAVGGA